VHGEVGDGAVVGAGGDPGEGECVRGAVEQGLFGDFVWAVFEVLWGGFF